MGKQHVSERDTSMSQVFGLTYGQELATCLDCGRKLTAEERLLAAILGEDSGRCKECFDKHRLPKCVRCSKPISQSIEVYYGDTGPYHSTCLPGAEYELP